LDTISKWIKKNLEIAMGSNQEGFSFDQVICNRGRILFLEIQKVPQDDKP
jgi:hypothetical protein